MSYMSELNIDLQNMTQGAVDSQVASVFTKAAIHDVTVRVLANWFDARSWYFAEQSDGSWAVQSTDRINVLYFTTFGEMLEFLLMDVEQTR